MSKATLALVLCILFNLSCKPVKKNVHFRNSKIHLGDSVDKVYHAIHMRRDYESDYGNGEHYLGIQENLSDEYQLCMCYLTFKREKLVKFDVGYTFYGSVSNHAIKILSKEIPLLKGPRLKGAKGPVWEKEEDGVRYTAHVDTLHTGTLIFSYVVER